jgi:hypothetical protein
VLLVIHLDLPNFIPRALIGTISVTTAKIQVVLTGPSFSLAGYDSKLFPGGTAIMKGSAPGLARSERQNQGFQPLQ